MYLSSHVCMFVCTYVFDILTMAFPIKQRKASVHIEWNIFQLHIFTAILRHFFRHDITHRVSSYWTSWGLAFSYYCCCVVAAVGIGKFHFFLYEFLSLEIKTQDLLCKFTFFLENIFTKRDFVVFLTIFHLFPRSTRCVQFGVTVENRIQEFFCCCWFRSCPISLTPNKDGQ